MIEKYNADLANGLGNLVSRVIKLSQNLDLKKIEIDVRGYEKNIDKLELDTILKSIWQIVKKSNQYIDENKPWELSKSDQIKFEEVMKKLFSDLYLISQLLIPFMPETAEKIKKALETKQVEPLFQRIK